MEDLPEQLLKIFSHSDAEDPLDENWFPFIQLEGSVIIMNEDHNRYTQVKDITAFLALYSSGKYYTDGFTTIIASYEIEIL